jgi:predicted permease
MALTVATALLLRGVYSTQTVNPGFDYKNVTVASFDFRASRDNPQLVKTFQRQLIDEIGFLPGVETVAQSMAIPLTVGRVQGGFRIAGRQDEYYEMNFNAISPEYFALLDIPIVSGRNFVFADLKETPQAAIVTEATARRYWPRQKALGQRIILGAGPDSQFVEIIGIAKDVQMTRIGEIDSSYFYLPANPLAQTELRLLIRSSRDFASLVSTIRSTSSRLDPRMVVRVTRLEESLEVWRALSASVTALSASLGLLALALAVLGVYGVGSYAVTRRLREFGIRMALGATGGELQRMVLRQMMRPIVVAAVLGVGVSLAVSQALRAVLFGVSPFDPLALIAATLFLVGVAAAATLIPARRATRIDPIVTLRL